jgi:hypothetical protein
LFGVPSPANGAPGVSGSYGSDTIVTRSSTTFIPILLPPPGFEKKLRPSSAWRAPRAPAMSWMMFAAAVGSRMTV